MHSAGLRDNPVKEVVQSMPARSVTAEINEFQNN